MCKKILTFKFYWSSYWQNIDFLKKLPQIPHIHKNCNFLKCNWKFLDQLLHPYKFHYGSVRGILFFNFASCESLTHGYHVHIHDETKNYNMNTIHIFQRFLVSCWTVLVHSVNCCLVLTSTDSALWIKGIWPEWHTSIDVLFCFVLFETYCHFGTLPMT